MMTNITKICNILVLMALLVLCSTSSLSANPNFKLTLGTPDYREQSSIDNVIKKSKSVKEEDEEAMATKLVEDIAQSGSMLSEDQTVQFVTGISIRRGFDKVLSKLNKYVCISFEKYKQLLIFYKNSKIKRKHIVMQLANAISDIDNAKKEEILTYFRCPQDKVPIKEYLKTVNPRDCFLGKLDYSIITFVFDVSFSMTYNKLSNDISRFDFIQGELIDAIKNLQSNQKFNLISFSEKVDSWKNDVVDATEKNKAEGVSYVTMKNLGYTTNISGALERAFKTQYNVDLVFVFTDGEPTEGVEDTNEMANLLKSWNNKRVKQGLNAIKVNVNLFMLGGTPETYLFDYDKAKAFSQVIADSTNGVVKNYIPKVE